jgi:hypothetical protein
MAMSWATKAIQRRERRGPMPRFGAVTLESATFCRKRGRFPPNWMEKTESPGPFA